LVPIAVDLEAQHAGVPVTVILKDAPSRDRKVEDAAPRSGDAEVEIRELRVRLADKDAVIDDLRQRLDREGEERPASASTTLGFVDRPERAAAAGGASWVMVAAVAWSTVSGTNRDRRPLPCRAWE
jgi:hypothetical protein